MSVKSNDQTLISMRGTKKAGYMKAGRSDTVTGSEWGETRWEPTVRTVTLPPVCDPLLTTACLWWTENKNNGPFCKVKPGGSSSLPWPCIRYLILSEICWQCYSLLSLGNSHYHRWLWSRAILLVIYWPPLAWPGLVWNDTGCYIKVWTSPAPSHLHSNPG